MERGVGVGGEGKMSKPSASHLLVGWLFRATDVK